MAIWPVLQIEQGSVELSLLELIGAVVILLAAMIAIYVHFRSELRAHRQALKEFRSELNEAVSKEVAVEASRILLSNFSTLRAAEEAAAKAHHDTRAELEKYRSEVAITATVQTDLTSHERVTEPTNDTNNGESLSALRDIAFAAQLDKILPTEIEAHSFTHYLLVEAERYREQGEDLPDDLRDFKADWEGMVKRHRENRERLEQFLTEAAKKGHFYYDLGEGQQLLIPSLRHRVTSDERLQDN